MEKTSGKKEMRLQTQGTNVTCSKAASVLSNPFNPNRISSSLIQKIYKNEWSKNKATEAEIS